MNGIEKITDRIKTDALAEMRATEAATKAQCSEILAGYKEKAQSAYWKIVSEGKLEADRLIELSKNSAQTESKKRMLQLKQEMVSAAFEGACKKLAALPKAEYVKFLVSLAVKASATGKEKIVLSSSDRKKCGDELVSGANAALKAAGKTGELTLSDETRNISGGLILSSGKIETNCSVETLVELRRNELSGEVAKILFE